MAIGSSSTSPIAKYRELARKIAEQLAKRFGHNPYVLGWQIDNEYSDISFDPDTKSQFQQWLKARYGTLDNLNARWTTSYWSETIFDWSQVPIQTQYGNPGLLLAWKRFVSDTWRSYQKNQLEVIRANSDPRQFITTNTMGWFDGFDHYVVEKDLDLASWDDYVGQGHLDPAKNGFAHDLTRGFKGKNFWVMETQPGSVNWAPGQQLARQRRSPGDGLARRGTRRGRGQLLAVAQRAEWPGGISRHAGGSGRNARALICGSAADWPGVRQGGSGAGWNVGQIRSRDAAFLRQPLGHRLAASQQELRSQRQNWSATTGRCGRSCQSIDVVEPVAPLSQYKLVVAPGLNVLSDAAAKNLIDYVRGGGHLVLGQRSAMKDEDNGLQPQRQPGPLADLLGGRVEQYYALLDPVAIEGKFGSGQSKLWAELLSANDKDTEVLETYGKSNGWLDGKPAAITRKVGKGRITYIGAWLDGSAMNAAAKWMADVSGVKPALGTVPDGVEVYPRYGDHGVVYILVNLSKAEQTVALPSAMTDVLEGGSKQSVKLPVYGVAVLSK